MSELPLLDSVDDEFSGFLGEVTSEIRQRAQQARIVPDFAESVARARVIAPDVVSEATVREASALAPVIPIEFVEHQDRGPDPELAAFLGDVKLDRDEVARQRQLSGIPATPVPRRGRRSLVLWALGACAAIAALWWGLSSAGWVALDRDRAAPIEAPFNQVDRDHQTAETVDPNPVRRAATVTEAADATDTEAAEAAETDAFVEPEEAEPELAEAGTDIIAGKRRRPNKAAAEQDTLSSELERLDAEAQARLGAGDRKGAEALYREIIRRGKRGRYVQLAYGDLFTIVRTTRGPAGEAELWQEYVRRFPRGPHADDARSGLCRRMGQGPARAQCWTDYLQDFPKGSHRGQAKNEAAAP